MSERQLICVDPALVSEIYPIVKDCIYQAIKRGNFGAYQPVEDNVLAGRSLLWVAVVDGRMRAAAVTSICQTEWRRVCEIVACGGRGMNEWVGLITRLETYARAEGCYAIRIIGRVGWQRVLKDYKPRRVILEKDLA